MLGRGVRKREKERERGKNSPVVSAWVLESDGVGGT
jgi:hypothetical protein